MRGGLAVVGIVAVLPVCGIGIPARAQPEGLGCGQLVSAVNALRADERFPPYFSAANPVKQGGEFDPNRYFEVLRALRMRDGFIVDYVYHQDGMGGYPILYARALDQPPYRDESAYRAAGDHPDYLRYVEPRDDPRGYFELALFAVTANQFYLDWHANYNDWRIVCDADGVDEIIASLGTPDVPGAPMDPEQQAAARAIVDVPPSVTMEDRTVTVRMVVFTKWGGFVRRTLTIARPDHSFVAEQDVPLVAYDCGITF